MPNPYFLPQDCTGNTQVFFRRYLRRQHPVPDFPRIIQIQTQSGCNADCQFCPNHSTRGKISMGRMDEEMFHRIIDEAVKHPVRRISPYLMNEPLADDRLPDLIRYITDRKHIITHTKINTNAAFLTESMGERLIESGLDRLHVSFHGIHRKTYEASMGKLSWKKNLTNVNRFIELQRRLKAIRPRLKITMVHTKTIDRELPEIREYWNSRGIAVNIHALENRSNKKVEDKALNIHSMQPLSDCDRLMKQAYILWNGDCILCCVDWFRSTVMGSINEKGLQSVWQNDKYLKFRRRFLAGQVEGTLCERCKVQNEIDFSFKPRFYLINRLIGKQQHYAPQPALVSDSEQINSASLSPTHRKK